MSTLNQLLDAYSPPALPEGLAKRAAAAAAKQPQEKARGAFWRRGARRGGWKRGALIGSAVVGLAFTSAVAAEVVSGGAIEIPVAHQVVEAIPALKARTHPVVVHHRELAVHKVKPAAAKPAQPALAVASLQNPPQTVFAERHPRLVQGFQAMQQRVAEKRAAGIPTPYADKLEAQASRIVQNRQAKGLASPPVEQVEMRLALRQARQRQLMRRIARDPSAISDAQVQRLAQFMPPQRRERFLALSPEMQRQLILRRLQWMQQRGWKRMDAGQQPPSSPEPPQAPPPEGNPQQPR